MGNKILALLVGEAIAKGVNYEAAPGGYLVSLTYKQMKDAPKPPASFIACLPNIELPSTNNAALDTILAATMEGYAESLLRKLRKEEKDADSIEFAPEDFDLAAIVTHAEEQASSLKLSEQVIGAWWKAEGEVSCTASYMAQFAKTEPDEAVTKAVANMAVLFTKLSAPTPDVLPQLCEVLLRRISLIEQPSSTTQAIRRKLQKRIDDAALAATLLSNEGAV